MSFNVPTSKRNSFKEKYLKYKQKYLNPTSPFVISTWGKV